MEDVRPSRLTRLHTWWNRATEENGAWQATAFLASVGLLIFLVVEPLLMRAGRLKDAEYFESSVLLASCLTSPAALVPALLGAALLVFGWKRLRYENWADYGSLRVIFGGLAIVVAWALAAVEYDYYWDQARIVDRILISVLAALVWTHPGWLGLFTPAAVVLFAPYAQVLDFTWTDKIPVFSILSLGVAFCWLKLAAPRLSFLPCLCAMLWVTSLAYLKPGLGKLAYGWEWIASNDLANLHQAAVFQNGWTTDLSPWLREWLDSSMLYLNTPLKIGTLILEVGILLIVARRSLAVLFLVGCSSMHLGIFIFSGIYFWKWIAMDLLLAGVLAALPAEKVKELFRPQLAAFGLAAIAVLLGLYKRPPTLAWLDSPLARRWHIEAVGESGARYQIPPSALAPYDLTIAQARLDFLSDRTYFVGCFGCIKDVKLCRAVSAAQSAAEVEKIREAIPTRKHEPESYRRFERLLKQYVQRGPSIADYGAFAYLKAPQHIWSRPIPGGAPAYEFQEPIARIEIFAQEAWRRPDGMQPIHQDLAFRLNFSEPAAMAAAPDAPIFK